MLFINANKIFERTIGRNLQKVRCNRMNFRKDNQINLSQLNCKKKLVDSPLINLKLFRFLFPVQI